MKSPNPDLPRNSQGLLARRHPPPQGSPDPDSSNSVTVGGETSCEQEMVQFLMIGVVDKAL